MRRRPTPPTVGTVVPMSAEQSSDRVERWASTMAGAAPTADLRVAHATSTARVEVDIIERAEREARDAQLLSSTATRCSGAGNRAVEEAADPWRTAFERDRDRILHAAAFRRLAGKTQVFLFPDDHQRTRLTHALEVAQVAMSVAKALRLNVVLTEAIALGHDCGHGPGGHASEDALSPYVEGGYDHAVWGADVALAPLNLCAETLDGVRNHSWSRPNPSTPEGEVVSWADRIAYVCHDLEDALAAGVVRPDQLPSSVVERCGVDRSQQLAVFIRALARTSSRSGLISMDADTAQTLADLRRFNYEQIYLRPESQRQNAQVIDLLQALVEHYCAYPEHLPGAPDSDRSSEVLRRAAVTYVGGMTDRFACDRAVDLLKWSPDRLPRGIDVQT
jgi:dGTPase